ncbi:NUDIX hydrolase [Frankia sp. Cr2]|uniref:NUDIX hydrolase n=1 Tax=Frankia sp. Cr2 TaxID=3073932 RepID=UPI002AD4857A|nr:NUDIX hydrolase [Frankia sp. Cr2]
MTAPKATVACRAVLRYEGRLLLVTDGNGYWYTPGGRLDSPETLPQCVTREVWEETGLRVTVGDVVAVSEFIDVSEGQHKVECFFSAELVEPPAEVDDWQDIAGPVRSFGFFDDSELVAMNVQPQFLKSLGSSPGPLAHIYVQPN